MNKITDKTRKILWAKSGNQCSICRTTLVHQDDNSCYVIGNECHIISLKPSGPRFIEGQGCNSYKNLILLCPNDHALIDKNIKKHTIQKLKEIKSSHEEWVNKNLNKSDKSSKVNDVSHLTKLNTGREIMDIIMDSEAYDFNYDEVKTKNECEYISSILQEFKDYGECSSAIDISERVNLGFELNSRLNQLEELGFLIFGAKIKTKMCNKITKGSYGIWEIATLRIIRKDNPEITSLDSKTAETT
jgi:hypothetical protein